MRAAEGGKSVWLRGGDGGAGGEGWCGEGAGG